MTESTTQHSKEINNAHPAHRGRRGYRPPRTRGRAVSIAWRRRFQRSRWPPACTARRAPGHHPHHADGSRPVAGSDDYEIPRRA